MGKEAIRSWYDGILKTVRTNDISVTNCEVVVAGDWGIEQGDFKWTLKPVKGNDVIVDNVKFIGIWHRKADGSWALQRDIWNSNLPSAGSNGAK